jgi:tryptophan synthase alpha chain
VTAPVILFTYFNLVNHYGLDRFARDAASAGACAVIVPDIPVEECAGLAQALATSGLEMPLFVTPTTPRHRAELIARHATGVFLVFDYKYSVSFFRLGGFIIVNFNSLRKKIYNI